MRFQKQTSDVSVDLPDDKLSIEEVKVAIRKMSKVEKSILYECVTKLR